MINTIGPVWDGNEVWLLVAGGATFAAFPEWYATLFSGFYLPLLLILVALIVRGVAFEYRGKRDDPAGGAAGTSRSSSARALPALLWGVAFANIVRGVPIDADHEYTGNLFTLLNPYALLGGLATLHAVHHCTARCSWRSRPTARSGTRARALAGRIGLVAAVRRGGVPASGPSCRTATRWSWALGAARRGRAAGAALVASLDGPGGLGVRLHRRHDRGWPWRRCSPRCSRT